RRLCAGLPSAAGRADRGAHAAAAGGRHGAEAAVVGGRAAGRDARTGPELPRREARGAHEPAHAAHARYRLIPERAVERNLPATHPHEHARSQAEAPGRATVARDLAGALERRFGPRLFPTGARSQATADGIPTLWLDKERIPDVLRHLKTELERPYEMLYDLTVIDERVRDHRHDQPPSDFSLVYHLLSFSRNEDLRIKVPLAADDTSAPTITGVWPNANWYEREAWDMFGVRFDGHPNLRRILTPPTWEGHPLRKEHPARATEMGRYALPDERYEAETEALRFVPEEWGMRRSSDSSDFMFLNLGPNHPSVHGVFRILLQLDGEEIVDAVPDIGWHHRAQEKMGERQSWHTYIPYTDR